MTNNKRLKLLGELDEVLKTIDSISEDIENNSNLVDNSDNFVKVLRCLSDGYSAIICVSRLVEMTAREI